MLEEFKTFLKTREPLNLTIVVINILIFIVFSIMGNTEDARFMAEHGAAYTPYITDMKEYYRLFTSMFLHFGLEHLVYNMLMLVFLGDMIEQLAGKIGYLVIYFGGGLAANLVSVWIDQRKGEAVVSAGASGAIFALIGALVLTVIINRGVLKQYSGRRILLMAALSIGEGFTRQGIDNAAHVGGFCAGVILAVLFFRRLRLTGSQNNRRGKIDNLS